MTCSTGIHCATGAAAWRFADEEPPYSIGWFTASFAGVLLTRAPTAAIAFVLLSQVAFEALHLCRALLTHDNDGGPLDPNPGGIFGLFFGPHPVTESLLITYPFFSVLGALIGYATTVAWNTPVYLQSYFTFSKQDTGASNATWYMRQFKFSTQLVLVAYFPHWIAFGIAPTAIGIDKRAEILAIWWGMNMLLIALFWWWNLEDVFFVWGKRTLASSRTSHARFHFMWAAATTLVWAPLIALSATSIPSQLRVVIGILLLVVVLSSQTRKLWSRFREETL